MTRDEYLQAVGRTVAAFLDTLNECIAEGRPIEEINDEFMLELYEQTGDKSRA